MSTKVLDLVTPCRALSELSNRYLGDCQWTPLNDEQEFLVTYYEEHRKEIDALTRLKALASTSSGELNQFLTDNGFAPKFESLDGIGVASILDMLMQWAVEGTDTTIVQHHGPQERRTVYPAFEVDGSSVDIFRVSGYCDPLVRLNTTTGDNFWVMRSPAVSGIELAMHVQQLLNTERQPHPLWTDGARLPKLDIVNEPDLNWMTGLHTRDSATGPRRIDRAFQEVRIRVNECGARVKAVTGLVSESCMVSDAVHYELDSPFVGFFTQQGSSIPIAALWADYDSWREPEGSLEDL